MELEYELFDKLKEESSSSIDRHSFVSKVGGSDIEWDAHFEALRKLAERKLIRVEGVSRQSIVLLPNFYDAVTEGGIDEWEKVKKAEKELNIKLIESSILTNRISKRTAIVSTIVAVITLLVLLYEMMGNRIFNSNAEIKQTVDIQKIEITKQSEKAGSDKMIDSVMN